MLFLTVKKLKALAKEWDLQTQQEFKDLYAKYLYLEASKEILKSGQNLERKSLKDRLKDFLHDSEIDEYFKLKIGESLHEQQIERENRERENNKEITQKEKQIIKIA